LLELGLIDEFLAKLTKVKPKEQADFIQQLIKEKTLYNALHDAGYSVAIDDPQTRARQQPFGLLSTVHRIDTVDIPVMFNVTMTLADTEYSQELPLGTSRFSCKTRDGTAFRVAFETGKVATPTQPYGTVPPNWEYYETDLRASATLYFACGVAGKIVEITVWRE
jgi:hypothetical protein